MKIVEVVWEDARETMEDHKHDEFLDTVVCTNVGYLIFEDDRKLVLCNSINHEVLGSQFAIPRGMVQEIRILQDD